MLPAARRLAWALPAALVYYVTVASADNWSGATCNLGRYIMPVIPLALAFAALTLADAREGVWTMALALAGFSVVLARLLWQDPHAANDCALLLARSVFADGNVYVPNLFLRTWADAAPGLWARLLAWLGARGRGGVVGPQGGRAGGGVRRPVAVRRGRDRPVPRRRARALAVRAHAARVERRDRPRGWLDRALHGRRHRARRRGAARVPGTLELVVRARDPKETLALTVEGEGVIRDRRRGADRRRGRPLALGVPLAPLRRLAGRRGVQESLSRQDLRVEGSLRPPRHALTAGRRGRCLAEIDFTMGQAALRARGASWRYTVISIRLPSGSSTTAS